MRRARCLNNLKQMAAGCMQGETAFGAYPSWRLGFSMGR